MISMYTSKVVVRVASIVSNHVICDQRHPFLLTKINGGWSARKYMHPQLSLVNGLK